jgi:hypothetical protein
MPSRRSSAASIATCVGSAPSSCARPRWLASRLCPRAPSSSRLRQGGAGGRRRRDAGGSAQRLPGRAAAAHGGAPQRATSAAQPRLQAPAPCPPARPPTRPPVQVAPIDQQLRDSCRHARIAALAQQLVQERRQLAAGDLVAHCDAAVERHRVQDLQERHVGGWVGGGGGAGAPCLTLRPSSRSGSAAVAGGAAPGRAHSGRTGRSSL